MFLDKIVSLSALEILSNHFPDKLPKGGLWAPNQAFLLRFGGISQKGFDFGRTEITRIDTDNDRGAFHRPS